VSETREGQPEQSLLGPDNHWTIFFASAPNHDELQRQVSAYGHSLDQGRLGQSSRGWQWELHPDFIPDEAEASRRREEWDTWGLEA
jgi:hypothetical protein